MLQFLPFPCTLTPMVQAAARMDSESQFHIMHNTPALSRDRLNLKMQAIADMLLIQRPVMKEVRTLLLCTWDI